MTAPSFDISTIVPLKYKPLVGLIGSALTFIVPTVLEYSTELPNPWPWVIALVVAVLTAVGIYRAPYKPQGTVLVPEAAVTGPTVTVDNTVNTDPVADDIARQAQQSYRNPWQ